MIKIRVKEYGKISENRGNVSVVTSTGFKGYSLGELLVAISHLEDLVKSEFGVNNKELNKMLKDINDIIE